jgi:hypothetical protein
MRRLAAHPGVAAALAAADISPSWAFQVCKWTEKLPADVRDDADAILLGAADGGADLAGLSGLAREIYERTAPPDPDDVPPGEDEGFRDRWLRLDVHFRGAGRIEGDLTPGCAAAVAALLESLGKKAGPEDDRSQGQRHHDALEEASRMLLGTGSLPDVAGQPAQMLVHATLGQLLGLADGSGLAGMGGADGDRRDARLDPTDVPDAFLAGQAAGDGEPGWLATAAAAHAYACDARIAAVITGHIEPEAVAAAGRAFPGPPGLARLPRGQYGLPRRRTRLSRRRAGLPRKCRQPGHAGGRAPPGRRQPRSRQPRRP